MLVFPDILVSFPQLSKEPAIKSINTLKLRHRDVLYSALTQYDESFFQA